MIKLPRGVKVFGWRTDVFTTTGDGKLPRPGAVGGGRTTRIARKSREERERLAPERPERPVEKPALARQDSKPVLARQGTRRV